MGFGAHIGQACLFYWKRGSNIVLVMLYVDDILVTGNNQDKIQETKRKLCSEFRMKVMGEPKKFLGIEIEREKKKSVMTLSQTKFIRAIIQRFGMENSKGADTPMVTNQAERKTTSERRVESTLDLRQKIPYREAVGALMYLTNCTRPDIAFSVNMLARKMSDYNLDDWLKVERVIKYLVTTKDLKLTYKATSDTVHGYCDASLGLNDPKGLSTSGHVIRIFGDPVSWGTSRQKCVATSSMEAEYVSLNKTCKEVIYLNHLRKLMTQVDVTPVLFEDNQATIAAIKAGQSKALKHLVKLKYFFVMSTYEKHEVDLKWIETKKQLADMFTKALPRPLFQCFRDAIVNFV